MELDDQPHLKYLVRAGVGAVSGLMLYGLAWVVYIVIFDDWFNEKPWLLSFTALVLFVAGGLVLGLLLGQQFFRIVELSALKVRDLVDTWW